MKKEEYSRSLSDHHRYPIADIAVRRNCKYEPVLNLIGSPMSCYDGAGKIKYDKYNKAVIHFAVILVLVLQFSIFSSFVVYFYIHHLLQISPLEIRIYHTNTLFI